MVLCSKDMIKASKIISVVRVSFSDGINDARIAAILKPQKPYVTGLVFDQNLAKDHMSKESYCT